ncbi:hypothetical protein QJS10_CPB11g00730 [Acorus calamus]|uniref:Uncharacterized protein n=1 Tax=Acorus calamus TaxID=4465 RepID=A0AAV9DV61_ACOCL|nr:hypothetical protein QJS10_CPB11g00730 [Acorus calamus]
MVHSRDYTDIPSSGYGDEGPRGMWLGMTALGHSTSIASVGSDDPRMTTTVKCLSLQCRGSLLIKEETLAFTEAEIHFKTETENLSADSTTRSEQVDRNSSVIQECEKDFIIKLAKLILIKPKSANNTTFSSANSTSPATEKEVDLAENTKSEVFCTDEKTLKSSEQWEERNKEGQVEEKGVIDISVA